MNYKRKIQAIFARKKTEINKNVDSQTYIHPQYWTTIRQIDEHLNRVIDTRLNHTKDSGLFKCICFSVYWCDVMTMRWKVCKKNFASLCLSQQYQGTTTSTLRCIFDELNVIVLVVTNCASTIWIRCDMNVRYVRRVWIHISFSFFCGMRIDFFFVFWK